MRRYSLYWLLFFFIQFPGYSTAQKAEDILKASVDSLSRIRTFSYEAGLSQYKNENPVSDIKKVKVVLERSKDDSSVALFIASADTQELIFDGWFGFVVNHRNKTVNQVNPLELKKNTLYDLVHTGMFTGYGKQNKFLNKKTIAQDEYYWILNFKTGKENDIKRTWISKKSLLPEKVLRQKSPANELMLRLSNPHINESNLPRAGTHMVKYIDTYTLLPVNDLGITIQAGSRDSLVDQPAPYFALKNIVNEVVVKLSDYKGKYILLNFWEVWCGSCRMSMPHLEELYRQYNQKGFEIIGLTKDNPVFAKKILNDKKITYLNVMADEKVKQDFKVDEIPQYYLIDREGKILYASKNGFEQKIEDFIKMLLK